MKNLGVIIIITKNYENGILIKLLKVNLYSSMYFKLICYKFNFHLVKAKAL